MFKMLSGFTFVFGVLIGSLDIVNGSYEWIFLFCIVVSFFFLLISTFSDYKSSLSRIINVALIIRFLIMLWNVYGRDIYFLPGVGTDTEGFYRTAVAISEDISLLKTNVYGSYYSKYLGLLYYFTKPSYLLGSYLNYLFSVLSISVLYRTLRKIEALDEKSIHLGMMIFAFEPISMCIGSSMRRESLIVLFIVMSLYYIFKWVEIHKTLYGLTAIIFVLAGSVLHAGVIGMLVGYIILLLFYDPDSAKWHFNKRSILIAGFVAVGSVLIITRYRNTFLAKIMIENQQELFEKAARARGGSAYLTRLNITSFRSLLMHIPIKLFYFITSPVPWNWRGASDVFAFVMDAFVYIFLVKEGLGVLKIRKSPVIFSVSIAFLVSVIIYAVGTQNSGTAMRHRLKLLGIMIVIMCMVHAYKNKKSITVSEREIAV